MGVEKCYKYEDKAYRYQKENEELKERIKDLKSVPSNTNTKERIKEFESKSKKLEEKRVEAMDRFYECLSAGHGSGDKKK